MTDVTPPVDPALAFDSPELAVDALRAWVDARRDLDDRRDALVRGALAAGVSPTEIERCGVASRTTTNAILKKHGEKHGAIQVAVPIPPTVEYAALLEARASQPTTPARVGSPEHNEQTIRAVMMRQAAQQISSPPDDPALTEDAWLQLLAVRYRRASDPATIPPAEKGWAEGYSAACIQIADEITAIRRLGEAAFTQVFDPAEVAAGLTHLAETNRDERR
ncbi:hypothetical protein GCM10010466_39160 [Planomonospora alba]|uniref:Uncharacterized protein n=1 Tax=Planomonospora alba TaxID=161354 RepID=A0ABP6NFB1_9ACTN